ncbi:response regulator [Verrucomicrobium sp. BvORR034]|jgi:FixJ family two-component response regulator|uniref:response regulator transcription factor n=1 Tax=Verrucomicrobium sp. BvORR034 TaxID=1396418 RepID=UPI0007C7CEDB|nr:response regulator [Verrucomicrobium sp. BvORR034]
MTSPDTFKSGADMVYLLDDEPGMLKALQRLLTAEGFRVRPFTTMSAFLDAYRTGEPACLVLDVSMPDLDGMEVQEKLHRDGLLIPIVFLTGRGSIPLSVRAIKAGAIDFLTKPVDDADLLRAVRAGLEQAADHAALATSMARLTPRERQVMKHVVAGRLNKQIAAELGTGEQTIKVHRARLMQKLNLDSVADLVRAAEKSGLHRQPLAGG